MRRAEQGKGLSGLIWAGLVVAIGSGVCKPNACADPPSQAATPRPGSSVKGLTVVAVTTSTSQPRSKALLQALRSHPWFVANAQRVRLVEVPTEPQATTMGRLGVSVCPAITVYGPGADGHEMLGGRSGFARADQVIEWLRGLEQSTVEARPVVPDPNVSLTNLEKCPPLASQQGYAAPPASVPQTPLTPSSVPQQPLVPQSTPMMYTPVTSMTTASVVQAPPQNFVIQQQPAQIFFAPQGSATVYVPQGTAPAMTAASNLFMPSAIAPASVPTSLAPASVPMALAPASVPMALMPASVPTPTIAAAGVAPAANGAAITTQSVSVPASRTSSRVRVRGPGPLASAAARFGERLTTLGRTRIETVQETRLETQTAQSPPGQFMTLSSTSATPTMPQNVSFPASVPPLPVPHEHPQAPTPSPQTPQKHHWFDHDD
jgi:hypothetical protein